jgi:hypothetical protein
MADPRDARWLDLLAYLDEMSAQEIDALVHALHGVAREKRRCEAASATARVPRSTPVDQPRVLALDVEALRRRVCLEATSSIPVVAELAMSVAFASGHREVRDLPCLGVIVSCDGCLEILKRDCDRVALRAVSGPKCEGLIDSALADLSGVGLVDLVTARDQGVHESVARVLERWASHVREPPLARPGRRSHELLYYLQDALDLCFVASILLASLSPSRRRLFAHVDLAALPRPEEGPEARAAVAEALDELGSRLISTSMTE